MVETFWHRCQGDRSHGLGGEILEVFSQRSQYEKGGPGKWLREFRDQRIFSLLRKDCHRVVDLGCGEGITLERLTKEFPDKKCLGVDLSTFNIETCRSYKLPVACGDIYHLGLKTASMDCCLLLDVIEHLKEPEAVLEEILRVLRPGGTLILVFPNDRMFFLSRLLFLKLKEAFYDAGHIRQWQPKKMRELLQKKGFRVGHFSSLPFLFWPVSLYHLIEAHKEPTKSRRDQ
jgi:SAM-dependent methyltransferase